MSEQVTSRWMARELCRLEGKQKQVDIAQMSETVKVLRQLLRRLKPWEVVRWIWERP